MSGFQDIKRSPSRFAESPQKRIQNAISELKRRGVSSDFCPRCNTSDWNVDLLDIEANSAMSSEPLYGLSGIGYPFQGNGRLSLLGIVCKNCGYSIFHNLDILGV